MSPEQLEVVSPLGTHSAGQLDGRSDLYALAIVLWELWQGQRPWRCEDSISSWNDAIQKHIELRREPLGMSRPSETPCELVLEKTLRAALSISPGERPADGTVMAAKLKLAIHPKAARLFEPHVQSWQYWMEKRSLYLVAALIVFVPNGLAGAINFQFNLLEVQRTHPELREYFGLVSLIVNSIAFSFGAYLLIREIRIIANAVERAKNNLAVSTNELDVTCNLGFRSAVNGAYLWLIAGLIFPLALGWIEPRFRLTESASFFLSIVGCGGMACIYPYFGLTLVSLQVIYPSLVSRRMADSGWKTRERLLRQRANCFLVAAAIVPLTVLGLLILVPESHGAFYPSSSSCSQYPQYPQQYPQPYPQYPQGSPSYPQTPMPYPPQYPQYPSQPMPPSYPTSQQMPPSGPWGQPTGVSTAGSPWGQPSGTWGGYGGQGPVITAARP